MPLKTSCYKCNERVLGCHMYCLKYKQYRKDIDTIKRNKETEKQKLMKTKRRSYSW